MSRHFSHEPLATHAATLLPLRIWRNCGAQLRGGHVRWDYIASDGCIELDTGPLAIGESGGSKVPHAPLAPTHRHVVSKLQHRH